MRLSIPTPCSQPWHKMQPAENGRFCDACQKKVVDFTEFTDKELINFFNKTNNNICGRFQHTQLDKKLVVNKCHSVKTSWLTVMLSTIAISTTVPTMASAKKALQEQSFWKTTSNDVVSIRDTVKGRVIGRDSLPIVGASVMIQQSTIGTVTDENGNFELKIPDSLQSFTTKLVISSVGYNSDTVSINPNVVNVKIQLVMLDLALSGEVCVVAGGAFVKRNFWQRIKKALFFWQ